MKQEDYKELTFKRKIIISGMMFGSLILVLFGSILLQSFNTFLGLGLICLGVFFNIYIFLTAYERCQELKEELRKRDERR